ncbi:hypothetical protein J5N97_012338 [Dioscorea zingiberensis]|uniref:Thioredoxin domain-containing protein n=1 Tax=Dioscorea zingiberensis TaxID=325984 RepID=A0A9D5HHP4_9LILI|nr:hypothetical protein J5N97_012338 [Dioscorea zingiberensis]
MAVCSTSTAIPSCNISHSISLDTSKLSAFSSLPSAPLPHRRPSISRGLSTTPHRRITPRVQAKKETITSLDELLENSDKPVLVDFYATWCGPCQYMVPILEEIKETMKDKIQVVNIDTEKYSRIADYYRIEALPTFIIFKKGKPCDRFEGAMPAELLVRRIYSAI